MTEFFIDGDHPINSFSTIFDYDYAFEIDNQYRLRAEDALRQKNSKLAEEYRNKSYDFTLRSVWARLIDNDTFYYVTILSGFMYLTDELREHVLVQVEKYYPSEIRDLRLDEEPDGFLSQLGLVNDAHGKEKHSQELTRRSMDFLPPLYEEIKARCANPDNLSGVVIKREKQNSDNHLTLIIANERTAKEVHWETIMDDAKAREIPEEQLPELIADLMIQIDNFMEQAFQDIEQNFEPDKVVPIKRMKVVFADSFIEDLEEMEVRSLISDEEERDSEDES